MLPEFVALDGEGLTRENGQHDYTLLMASDGRYIEEWEINGLDTESCLQFLIETASINRGKYLVGFSFGYDGNMLLRDLTRTHVARLHEINHVDWVPRKGHRYYIEFIPNKWISVSYSEWNKEKWKWERKGYAKVWDVFGFYQMSFVKALESWKAAPDDVIERIALMKEQRGVFDISQIEEIKSYCLEECQLLVGLCTLLAEALEAAGIELKQWHGAGAIANALLSRENALNHIVRKPDNDALWNAILSSYFGGRIETMVSGYVAGEIYGYDINSAYPSAIVGLPSLKGGTWEHVKDYLPAHSFAIWHVKWSLGRGTRIAPFPFRKDGNIYYTKKGEGWYHSPEVYAAYQSGIPIEILEGYTFTPCDDSKPFEWVADIYAERQRAKAAGDKREKVLKLGMNSLYGKFAQGVSQNGIPGRFQCYYYAGLITSTCRARILSAIMQRPDSILSVATDGIYSLEKLDLSISKTLGEWEEKEPVDDGLLFIQPGFILSRYGSLIRTRGIGPKSVDGSRQNGDGETVDFDLFYQRWIDDGIAGKVKARETRFISFGRALAGSTNTDTLNEKWRRWQKVDIEFGYFPSRKAPAMDDSGWSNADFVRLYPFWPFGQYDAISECYKPKELNAADIEAEPVEFIDSYVV